MSAPTQERGLSHPAARAVHAVVAAVQHLRDARPLSRVLAIAALEDVLVNIATLYQQNDANLRYIERLEAAESKHLLKVAELKTRLARAAENNEELYRLTSHAVGDATERHMIVARTRALLDLEIPLPPIKAMAISTPTQYGAPRAAANH